MLKQINVKKLVIGSVVGFASTAVFLFVFALLLFFTGIPDRAIELMAIVSAVLGVITGGVVSSFGLKCCGWLNGGISGIVYTLILWIISVFVFGSPDFVKLVINLAVGFIIGGSGGIAGINFKSKRKRKRRKK